MPTNPIWTGTKNFPVNAPVDWLKQLGRDLSDLGISQGEAFRLAIEEFVAKRKPKAAQRLRAIRVAYRAGGLLRPVGSAALLVVFVCGWLALDHDQLRASRSVRVAKSRDQSGAGPVIEV